jgi:hypothetical protein
MEPIIHLSLSKSAVGDRISTFTSCGIDYTKESVKIEVYYFKKITCIVCLQNEIDALKNAYSSIFGCGILEYFLQRNIDNTKNVQFNKELENLLNN